MPSFFRRRSADTIRVVHPEHEDVWIELKKEFSKGEMNSLGLVSPRNTEDREGGLNFLEGFLETAVENWSLTDENGIVIKPTRFAYRELAAEAGAWVDEVLENHLRVTFGDDIVEAEGKAETSPNSSSSDTEPSSE